MNVWKKKTVVWELNGKRVKAKTRGAKKRTTESKRFYGTLKTSDGKTKQVPLNEDVESSLTLLRRLQSEADHDRALGITPKERERTKPLSEHVADYEKHLRSKGNTERHVKLTLKRLRSLLKATKAKTIDDLDVGKIGSVLSSWRSQKKEPISVGTSNHYVRSVKSFTRWLWMERRTSDDPLIGLRSLNANVDVKRKRRAFSVAELRMLIEATEKSGETLCGLSPERRALLYLVAVYTGFRASELRSLSVRSFDLEAKTVTVEAAYSKRRRQDVLPIHPSLVDRLRSQFADAPANAHVFDGTWTDHNSANSARMMRADLKRVKIPYRDKRGRVLDFHALRHTFVTQLARAAIHPSKAKELARHSTITLTMDVYSHVETEELRDALDSVPGLD